MQPKMIPLMLGTLILPVIAGCGDKVVKDKQTESRSGITGTTTTTDQKTYQRPDGTQHTETQTQKSN